jgi:hypothetical protein
VPVGGFVTVLQGVVTVGLVPDLGEDVGQVGYALKHKEPVTVTADPPDQPGQFLGGHADVLLPVLRLHHDFEHAPTLTHPMPTGSRARGRRRISGFPALGEDFQGAGVELVLQRVADGVDEYLDGRDVRGAVVVEAGVGAAPMVDPGPDTVHGDAPPRQFAFAVLVNVNLVFPGLLDGV